jgi:PA domain
MKTLIAAGLLGLTLLAPATAANIILNNVDAPGIGFNDTTPAAAVGGNAGTTVGEQRLVAYRRALELWGKSLRSDVTIVVRGSFARLDCARGVLAQAGALQIFSDFPRAPLPGHWYGVALANAIAGEDLAPGPLDIPGPTDNGNDDIIASFNGDIGKADCLPGPGWYYGLDNNAPAGQIDFLDTFMHEVAHGLGFQNFVNEGTGSLVEGLPDVYMANTLDLSSRRKWNTLTGPEIVASALRNGQVVWAGRSVTANAPLVLGPFEGIRLSGALTGEPEFGTAAFGAPPSVANFSGAVVLATDSVAATGGGTITDGCEPITAAVAGRIALVDRGLCGFVVKAKNAQDAGATGLIVANTLGRGVAGMAGTDATVTIPSILVSNADGDAIKAALPTVNVAFFVDPTRRAGAAEGFVRLFAPPVYQPGSSISHFDTVASPSLLMEPNITLELRSAQSLDLTSSLMKDIGWKLETLKIGRCETGVTSTLRTGQMLHASIDACVGIATKKREFRDCVRDVTKQARRDRLLSGHDRSRILRCIGEHDHEDDRDRD